ncbi:MAG: calcium-binding protein, partial [Clostridiales bacterium]|nr:calcium-binding protein [Clostridiales bacterium]
SSTLNGNDGNDTLNAIGGNNSLYGGAGNDRLNGSSGNDILDGGVGKDTLVGGAGEDVYVFGKGYGQDIISDGSGKSTIRFLEGIEPEDLVVSREGNYHVKIQIKGTEDSIVLEYFTYSTSYQNIVLEFEDGTTGKVNSSYNDFELTRPEPIISDLIIQSNADLLSSIYEDNTISSNKMIDVNIANDIVANGSVKESYTNSNSISQQTTIQTNILIDNMAAFSNEQNISENSVNYSAMQNESELLMVNVK